MVGSSNSGAPVRGHRFLTPELVGTDGPHASGVALLRLIEDDRKHQSSLVAILQAWLDSFGDVGAAATSLFLRPNTFRYRLRRVAEVGEINLTDPEQRFVAMLQLRVLELGTDPDR